MTTWKSISFKVDQPSVIRFHHKVKIDFLCELRSRTWKERTMKRDMNLIRKILFEIEKSPEYNFPLHLSIEGYEEYIISYHVMLLAEADLINALDASSGDGPKFIPTSLTWEGHEFLEAAKDDTRWKKAVDTVVNKGGGIVFDILKDVLVSLTREAILGKI